jgi:SAM-dependent methyltransferase
VIVSNSVTDDVRYGPDVPADDELGLIGDVSAGRRVIELGISSDANAIALARQGAKAITVDPDPERIGELRRAATDAEVWVECHEGDLGDLGFAPSGTIDVVLSVHTLDVVDDLGRILRQVHRVLKPGAPFVLVLDHPFAVVGRSPDGTLRRYGDGQRTIGELLAALDRCNFRVEVFHELGVSAESPVPTTLVIKVRKQGS